MIKVNLLPVKKKKKAKPIPAFLISTIVVTLAVGAVLLYVVYFFSSRVSERQTQVKNNEKLIAELTDKIKAVEEFEKRNTIFQQRKEIIEQLGKNKTMPVKVLDELSALLPPGVWFNSMELKGMVLNLNCTAFTNTDVVNYVDKLKNSNILTEVFLQESVQGKLGNFSVYNFKLTMKVKT